MARKSFVKADEIQVKGNKIFSPVRQKWLPLTPEERVRQEYLRVLTQEYGYVTDQMAEEMDVTGRGSAQARADFAIWRSAQDKIDRKPPFIIVECKSDTRPKMPLTTPLLRQICFCSSCKKRLRPSNETMGFGWT